MAVKPGPQIGRLPRTRAEIRGAPPAAGQPGRSVRVLLRLSGEIATKSRRTRHRFQRALVENLRDACRSGHGHGRVINEWSRIFVEVPDAERVEAIGRVFGISSYSVLEAECDARLDEIVRTGGARFSESVRGRRFAVRARRTGAHPFRSQDVMRELGAVLASDATVDLDEPEVEVFVEVRDNRALFFSDRRPGPGGLPLGVEGRAVALISGGFDSAVAAWMALRRGVALEYVFCNLGGGAYRRLALEVAKSLADRWSYGARPQIHVVEFGEVARELRERVQPSLQQVLLKRQMYRAASRVATDTDADALVTGESLGQVSTQTLTNLRTIEEAAELPVLRPLTGFDKSEIIDLSRRIGTYDLCARVREYCAISPAKPATGARLESVRREEARMDPVVLDSALASRERLALRDLGPLDIVAAALFIDEVPAGAAVIDTREREEYERWHWPDSVHRDFEELSRRFGELDRRGRYVLVCAQGMRTAELAERMQAAGYEAYSFRAGAHGLRRFQTGSGGRERVES